jgi:hypothetical protein
MLYTVCLATSTLLEDVLDLSRLYIFHVLQPEASPSLSVRSSAENAGSIAFYPFILCIWIALYSWTALVFHILISDEPIGINYNIGSNYRFVRQQDCCSWREFSRKSAPTSFVLVQEGRFRGSTPFYVTYSINFRPRDLRCLRMLLCDERASNESDE